MNKIFIFIILLLMSSTTIGQDFNNGDFEGLPASIPGVPLGWRNVPISDIHCRAAFRSGTTTDLLDEFGPQKSDGEYGKPYSGKIFLSGLYGASIVLIKSLRYQEGIMQQVRGFVIGCEYEITFYQSVVKQHNARDKSGSWSVFLDNDSLSTSKPTFSDAPFDNVDLEWEKRSVSFLAKKTNYMIKFLPQDDDPIFGGQDEFLRMGLDNLSIQKKKITQHLDILGPDLELCDGDQFSLSVSQSGSSYLWQDGSTNSALNVTHSGTYWVEIRNECGILRDTVNIEFTPFPNVYIGDDVILCKGETLYLGAYFEGATYNWQDGTISSEFEVTKEGTYWVEVENACGIVRDSITIDYIEMPKVNLGDDQYLCEGDFLVLRLNEMVGENIWQDGSSLDSMVVSNVGLYWVLAKNQCGEEVDSIFIDFIKNPVVELGEDRVICEGDKLILNVESEGATYLWQDGSMDEILEVTDQNEIWVRVSNECGFVSDSIQIVHEECHCVIYIPNAFSPNGDGINDGVVPFFECGIGQYDFQIFDRWGERVFHSKNQDEKWDGRFKNKWASQGVYAYILIYTQGRKKQNAIIGSLTLIR